MKMSAKFVNAVFWAIISCTFCVWSSNINSVFIRSIQSSQFKTNNNIIESFENGIQMALEHCQEIFKWDRWNCPESAFSIRGRQPSTKESAFVLAISTAAVIHSLTRSCSRGEIHGCGCDPSPRNPRHQPTDQSYVGPKLNETWLWSGCSDYLSYGEFVAQAVIDKTEQGSDSATLVHLHNNAAGRTAVRATMQKRCRCHGVSGSCTLQTCWLEVAPFNKVATLLRKKYDRALKLDDVAKLNSVRSYETKIEVAEGNFVYLMDSPNYCKPGVIAGWNGTKGRACSRAKTGNVTAPERNSCRNLCRACGHRVKRQRKRVTRQCRCTFHWCCEVKCDICLEHADQFFCA